MEDVVLLLVDMFDRNGHPTALAKTDKALSLLIKRGAPATLGSLEKAGFGTDP